MSNVALLPPLPLCNPGWTLHLRRRQGPAGHAAADGRPFFSSRSMRRYLLAVQTPGYQALQAVRPAMSMCPDHWPQAYLWALEAFAERGRGAGRPGAGPGAGDDEDGCGGPPPGPPRTLPEVLAALAVQADGAGRDQREP